ncbi:MAG: hypothetical protein M3179_14525 [Actinomycetota bacterium]|nr:hypothetical protein [Actinomycetota bacterium]
MKHRSSGRLTRTTAWALVLLMTGFLAACGSNDDEEGPAPALTPPAGFTVVSSGKAGFAIAVPDDWIRLPLNGLAAYDEAAEKIQAQNPAVKDALDTGRTLIGRGVELFALDPTDNGATSANLLVRETPEDETLEVASKQSVDLLAQRSATGIQREYTQLGGVEATKISFTIPVQTADHGTRNVETTQYIALSNGKSYVLTLAGTGPDREAIVQSLRLA